MLKVLDLFSGIGGFSLGLERTGGFKTIAFCEVDPFCRRVLAKHWPGVPIRNDIRRNKFTTIKADVIVGGFPCQDISVAGRRAGITGKRSGLYRELIRAVRVVRPRYAIVENVAALLNRGLGTLLGDLAEIGYDAEWHCIPASAVGAPHQRDRIWIVANPRGEQHEGYCPPISGTLAAKLSRAAMADADIKGSQGRDSGELQERSSKWTARASSPLADADSSHEHGRRGTVQVGRERSAGEAAHDGYTGRTQWGSEPDVGRVAHGVSARVDKLRGLGNAVVPQIPELIGQAILEIERARLTKGTAPARPRGSHSRVRRESAELVA